VLIESAARSDSVQKRNQNSFPSRCESCAPSRLHINEGSSHRVFPSGQRGRTTSVNRLAYHADRNSRIGRRARNPLPQNVRCSVPLEQHALLHASGSCSRIRFAVVLSNSPAGCLRSRTGNLWRSVPSCSQYREQEQLCGAKLGEGIVTTQLVTINKKGA